MISLSYTISPNIRINLNRIDQLRERILLTTIPPKTELQLRWEARASRIYWTLNITGNKLTKPRVARLLSLPRSTSKKYTKDEKEIFLMEKTQNYIATKWLANESPVVTKVLSHLYNLSTNIPDIHKTKPFKENTTDLTHVLDYLNKSTDHPVIQAGISQIALRSLSPFPNFNGRQSRLISQMYLYKNGYNFRDFLVSDEFWNRNLKLYQKAIDVSLGANNLTSWLEFYCEGITHQLEKTVVQIREPRRPPGTKERFWQLDDRHRQILSLLDNPEEKMTNKKVKKYFKVSQITASRDLAKLTRLGLIFRHGKGRSVYYTRV